MIYKIIDQKTSENLIKISMAGFNFLFNFRSQNCNFIKNKLQRLSSKIHQIFQNTKSGWLLRAVCCKHMKSTLPILANIQLSWY